MRPQILCSKSQIQRRVAEVAREIDRHYQGRELVMIGVLNGSIIFLADLIRRLKTPLSLDFISVSSYGENLIPSKKMVFHPHLKISVEGVHVLLVDDILDTGGTVQKLVRFLGSMHPASVEVCVLLRKRIRRSVFLRPRFVGFDVPDQFVYGYGLDIGEKFRNLPYIACNAE